MTRRLLLAVLTVCSLFVFAGGANAAPGEISLAPAGWDYGQVTVGASSSPLSFTVTNVGASGSLLTISDIELAGANANEFVLGGNGCSAPLAAGTGCTIDVSFSPSSAGVKSASLLITSNAPDSPQIASLSGEGAGSGPVLLLYPRSQDFGQVEVGSLSPQQDFILANTGPAGSTLTVSEVILVPSQPNDDPSEFDLTNDCLSPLAAREQCTITVRFAPTHTGRESVTLKIYSNAPTSPNEAPVTGEGVGSEPAASLAPSSHDFGQVAVGSASPAQNFTLTNTGHAGSTLTVSDVDVTPATGLGEDASEFHVTNGCPSPLAVGEHCTITVRFVPTHTGLEVVALKVFSNAPTSPNDVRPLIGEGVAAQPSASASFTLSSTLATTSPPSPDEPPSTLPSLANPVVPTTPPPNLPDLEASWEDASVKIRAHVRASLAIPYVVNGYAAIEIEISRGGKLVWTHHTGVLEGGTYQLEIPAVVMRRLAAGTYTITLTATRAGDIIQQSMVLQIGKG